MRSQAITGIRLNREKLIYALINKGLTRKALSEISGVSASTILAAERREIKIETAIKLIKALGVKIEEIAEGEKESNS